MRISPPKAVCVNPAQTILRGVQKLLSLFPVTVHAQQMGFCLDDGSWLDSSLPWTAYSEVLSIEPAVQFRKRYATFIVILPGDLTSYHNLDARATVGHLLAVLKQNFLETPGLLGTDVGSPDDYALYVRDDVSDELQPERCLSSYTFAIENWLQYRKRFQPLTVYESGRPRTFSVDYMKPLSVAVAEIFRVCGVDVSASDQPRFLNFSDLRVLDPHQSLFAQSIRPPAMIILTAVTSVSVSTPRGAAGGAGVASSLAGSRTISRQPFYNRSSTIIVPTTNQQAPVVDGELHTATTAELVYLAITASEASAVSEVFFVTYPLFMSNQELASLLVEAFKVPSYFSEPQRLHIKLKIIEFILMWSLRRPKDVQECRTKLVDFIRLKATTELGKHAASLLQKLVQGLSTSSLAPIGLTSTSVSADSVAETLSAEQIHLWQSDPWLFTCNEAEIAAALTKIDLSIFRGLRAEEFTALEWTKESTQENTPTIVTMLKRFNAEASWVAALILEPKHIHLRAQRFEMLIRVADHLLQLNNFFSMMAFVSGMNTSAVSRLQFTRNALGKKEKQKLDSLLALMQPEGSWAVYRRALSQAKPPICPFIGVYLGDMIFATEGNPSYIDEKVNWYKCEIIHKIVNDIPRLQQQITWGTSATSANDQLLAQLAKLPLLSIDPLDSILYARSLEREPRGWEGPGRRGVI